MNPPRRNLVDYTSAEDALSDLCRGMCSHDASCLKCETVEPASIPEPFRTLLVHREHMTATLASHYQKPVELRVLEHELCDNLYRRRIVLTLAGTDRVVEFGIVRIDLSFTTDEVRSRIIERDTPLGEILIDQNVLREIEPRWYLRIQGSCPLLIGANPLWQAEAYGRVGTIYCDGQPAIELLEIVTPPKEV